MRFNEIQPIHLAGLAAAAIGVHLYLEAEKSEKAEASFDAVFAGTGPVRGTNGDGTPKPRYSSAQKHEAAKLVTRLYAAFHPYPVPSLFDGTDEQEIEAISTTAKVNKIGFDILAEYWKAKYKTDLVAELQSELGTDEWRGFVEELP
jgi:hypothetical protein